MHKTNGDHDILIFTVSLEIGITFYFCIIMHVIT